MAAAADLVSLEIQEEALITMAVTVVQVVGPMGLDLVTEIELANWPQEGLAKTALVKEQLQKHSLKARVLCTLAVAVVERGLPQELQEEQAVVELVLAQTGTRMEVRSL
jgi:hypothetical protein